MKAQLTTADIKELQQKFRQVTDLLQDIIDAMKSAGATEVTIHTKDAENKHLPSLWKWARKAKAEVELQLEIFEQAKRDRAAHDAKHSSRKRG